MAYDIKTLTQALVRSGLPVDGVSIDESGNATIQWQVTPTADQIAQANAILADPLYQIRRPRTIFSIYQDLNALTATQKVAVWADVSAGNPPKMFLNRGSNDAGMVALHWCSTSLGGATTAEKNDAKMRLVAMYCQDNPGYLRHPAFDPTINVPGDELDT